jgi:calcium-dependent protein kinase
MSSRENYTPYPELSQPCEATQPVETVKTSKLDYSYSANATTEMYRTQSRTKSIDSIRISRSNFVNIKIGRLEDHYKLLDKLGVGAYGSVHKAIDKRSKQMRAIKSLEIPTNKEKYRRVMEEVNILRTLDHPNIITIFEVINEDNKLHIITELCTGGELFERIIKTGYFSENLAAKIMFDIMKAVMYCHNSGIVHRDLKPENLLFENKESHALIKVIDFGTSKKLSPNTKLKSMMGTAYYIAPEVIDGRYDEKCDVWSCGVILYILLCKRYLGGYPPFNGKSDSEIFKKIKAGKFSFSGFEWLKVSKDAKNLLKKMLTLDPAERISAKEVLRDPWLKKRAANQIEDRPVTADTLKNLSTFRVISIQSGLKLQQATLSFIASQMSSSEEISKLRDVFIQLDTDGNGVLSREELTQGFKILGLKSVEDIEDIIQRCDADGSGFIDYSEFLTATINWREALSRERLEAAFKAYDIDGSGKITVEEIKLFIGGNDNIEEGEWRQVLEGVDQNGDGEVDFDEFLDLMTKHFTSTTDIGQILVI